MDELYPNHFVQYLYKECSEKQSAEIEELLQFDCKAKELFSQLKTSHFFLKKYFTLQHPQEKSIRSIWEYANK